MSDLDTLRSSATPGPWFAKGNRVETANGLVIAYVCANLADAEFIAAMRQPPASDMMSAVVDWLARLGRDE